MKTLHEFVAIYLMLSAIMGLIAGTFFIIRLRRRIRDAGFFLIAFAVLFGGYAAISWPQHLYEHLEYKAKNLFR